MKFRKIHVRNGWSGPIRLLNGRPLPKSGRATIRWSDGTVETVDFHSKLFYNGGKYRNGDYSTWRSSQSRLPVFYKIINGATVEIPLELVEIGDIS